MTVFLNISEGQTLLTPALDAIIATTDLPKVDVVLTRDPDGDMDEFFSTSIYPYGGRVELSGVGALIEQRFRAMDVSESLMELRIGDNTIEFIAVYCAYELPEYFDRLRCFRCLSASAVVHRGSAVALSHHNTGSHRYHITLAGITDAGAPSVVEFDIERSANAVSFLQSVNSIVDYAISLSRQQNPSPIEKALYFSVEYAEMIKVFYISDEPEFLMLRFRNLFNCPEILDISGRIRRKSQSQRDTVVCAGRARQYNFTTDLTYEVETGPLSADQALSLEDLFCSHQVELLTDENIYDILITEHTCERDNDDESLVTMKFSFRFAGSRMVLLPEDMRALTPQGNRIFTHEYSRQFC